MSILCDETDRGRPTSGCLVDDPASVEARFGLRHCGPSESTGNRCTFVTPGWARGPSGRLRVGALMVLADHILGELPYLERPANTWSLTTELTVDIVGSGTSSDTLTAEGFGLVADGRASFVQGRIEDECGTLVAVGTTRVIYVAARNDDFLELPTPRVKQHASARTIEELLELNCVNALDGIRVTTAETGSWVNGFGILHGGVSACLAEVAANYLFSAHDPRLVTSHIHTNYLRPVEPGAPYSAMARLRHVSRSAAVAEVVSHGAHRQACTVSTVTARRAELPIAT